jgi:hypothetical protein
VLSVLDSVAGYLFFACHPDSAELCLLFLAHIKFSTSFTRDPVLNTELFFLCCLAGFDITCEDFGEQQAVGW